MGAVGTEEYTPQDLRQLYLNAYSARPEGVNNFCGIDYIIRGASLNDSFSARTLTHRPIPRERALEERIPLQWSECIDPLDRWVKFVLHGGGIQKYSFVDGKYVLEQ